MGTARIYARTALAGALIAAGVTFVDRVEDIRPRDLRFVALVLLFTLLQALLITRNVLREHAEERDEIELRAAARPIDYSWAPQPVVQEPVRRTARDQVAPAFASLMARARRRAYRMRVRSSGISSPIRSLFR